MSFGAATGASLVTRLGVDGLDQYKRGMKEAGDEVDKFAKRSNTSLKSVGEGMTSAGKKLTVGLTTPIVAAGAASFKAFAGFDQTMRQFGAVSEISGAKLKGMSNLAIKMGRDTSFSAGQAADAMLELAKGGMTQAAIKSHGLKQTLTLAAAGGLKLGTAAGYVANTLNMFGMKASESARVAAALAGGANASTASVESLGQALSQVGSSATDSGMGLNETVAALAALDQAGVKGSDAGTSLKTMLMRLIPQSEDAAAAMKKHNLQFVNANGTFKSMAEVSQILKKNLGGLTEEQKKQALTTIFGSDASRAASILMKNGADGIKFYKKATEDLGAAQKLAKTNTEGAAGSIEMMKGSLETAGIQIGQALAPSVVQAAGGVADLANSFSQLNPEAQKTILVMAGMAAVVGPGLMVIGQMAQGLSALKSAHSAYAATALATKFPIIANPYALVATGAIIAGAALVTMTQNSDGMTSSMRKAAEATRDLGKATDELSGASLNQREADTAALAAKQQEANARKNLKRVMSDEKATADEVKAAKISLRQAEDASARATDNAARAKEKAKQAARDYSGEVDKLMQRLNETQGKHWNGGGLGVTGEAARDSIPKLQAMRQELARLGDKSPEVARAISKIDEAIGRLKSKTVTVTMVNKVIGKNAPTPFGPNIGPAKENDGGLIPGRGLNRDSVPALLTRGEYVIDRDTVDRYGPQFFRNLQKFNKGGTVGGYLAGAQFEAAQDTESLRKKLRIEQKKLSNSQKSEKNALNKMNQKKRARNKFKKGSEKWNDANSAFETARGNYQDVVNARKTAAGNIVGLKQSIKQAALSAIKDYYDSQGSKLAIEMAKARSTKDTADDNAVKQKMRNLAEARASRLGGILSGIEGLGFGSAALDSSDIQGIESDIASSLNEINSIDEETSNAASGDNNATLQAQLAQQKAIAEAERNRADINASAVRAFGSSSDIGYGGGANAYQAAGGSTVIINSLTGYDPKIQQAVADATSSGLSAGGNADKLYSGRVEVAA